MSVAKPQLQFFDIAGLVRTLCHNASEDAYTCASDVYGSPTRDPVVRAARALRGIKTEVRGWIDILEEHDGCFLTLIEQ